MYPLVVCNILATRKVRGSLLSQLLKGRVCLVGIMVVYERDQ